MDRFAVYIPGWLRWTLLAALAAIVAGFTVTFFVGIARPQYTNWLPASVSIVQIALTAMAYLLVVFFTVSAQSPATLQRRSEKVLTELLPQALAHITDTHGEQVKVAVGPASGVIGHDYTLRSANAELRAWVGLNVHRAIVILFCARPEGLDDGAFTQLLEKSFSDTIKGALAIGYDPAHFQLESRDGRAFASIWLTWNIKRSAENAEADFLTHSPSQLFFAQDVAMMVQSFLRTAERRGLRLSTPLVPMPL